MPRDNLNDVQAFVAVASARSFTRAAAELGVSQSALSHAIKAFENRLGVRLLTRNTRGVAPTEAGERLLQQAGPQLEAIRAELAAISELSDVPSGNIRITATDHAIRTLLWPRLAPFLREYPNIRVECVSDYGLVDIVAERFDLGVRFGDDVAQDMIAVRVGPDQRMVIAATPDYLARRPPPQTPQELAGHNCINLRAATLGGLYAWELQKGKRAQQVHVQGQLCFNGIYEILDAALTGFGLAYLPEDLTLPHLAAGRLVSVMADWCPTFPGYHVYFPGRRQSRALSLLVDALRYREGE